MTEPTAFYTIERHIADTDVDFIRRQRISSMFSQFQDIAGRHAENLGAAVNWLYETYNVAWVLGRVRVEIDRYPVHSQEVIIETWPQAPRALYERDYRIRDSASGEPLVRAASMWIIMDLAAREIKRDKFLDYFGLEMLKERALGKGVGRLKPMAGTEFVYEKEMKFSDLDYNLHVNNAKYVDYIMDSFSYDFHQENEVKAFEIHYINEIGAGDVLLLRRKEIEVENGNLSFYIDGVREADGMSVLNALVEWGEPKK